MSSITLGQFEKIVNIITDAEERITQAKKELQLTNKEMYSPVRFFCVIHGEMPRRHKESEQCVVRRYVVDPEWEQEKK